MSREAYSSRNQPRPIQDAEKQLIDAREAVATLEAEHKRLTERAVDADQAQKEARRTRDEVRGRVEAVLQSGPPTTPAAAEEVLRRVLREMQPAQTAGDDNPVAELVATERLLERSRAERRRVDNELHSARGQLALVGGASAKDQLDEELEALDRMTEAAAELELDFRAARRLLDALREAEATHAAHLGRGLAKPVTERFRELTGNRYGSVVLNPGMSLKAVVAGGGDRLPVALSVGTRDQLATLVRLALAAQLRSTLVLDDQLAQSDAWRSSWFRDRLRDSVRDFDHQIVVITCRPADYVGADEMPAREGGSFRADHDRLTVVDLERVGAVGDVVDDGAA